MGNVDICQIKDQTKLDDKITKNQISDIKSYDHLMKKLGLLNSTIISKKVQNLVKNEIFNSNSINKTS